VHPDYGAGNQRAYVDPVDCLGTARVVLIIRNGRRDYRRDINIDRRRGRRGDTPAMAAACGGKAYDDQQTRQNGYGMIALDNHLHFS
jgi:hypothetical protein